MAKKKAKEKEVKVEVKEVIIEIPVGENWKWISGILAILVILSLITAGFRGGCESEDDGLCEVVDLKGVILSNLEASQLSKEFIVDNLVPPGTPVEINSVVSESGVYKVYLLINNQNFTSYLTKDGAMMFPQGVKVIFTEVNENGE